MLFGETVAVYCQNQSEHTDALAAKQYNVNSCGTFNAVVQRVNLQVHYPDSCSGCINPLERYRKTMSSEDKRLCASKQNKSG
jgi:hypothetical protein